MGYELRRKLREALGPDITGLQRAVALEIADDAKDGTRESFVSLEEITLWTAAKDTNVVRNALKRLAAAGWEFRVPIGKGKDGRVLYAVPGKRMTFRVPPFEGGAGATPKGERVLPQVVAGATPWATQGVAVAHSGGAGAPSEGAGATPSSSYPSAPQEDKNSCSPPAAESDDDSATLFSSPAPPAGATDGQQQDGPGFEDFYKLYPRKEGKGAARKAFAAAIKRGATPDALIEAIRAHCAHWKRCRTEQKFIPHPATWLNGERYDDELTDPPADAPAGKGHRPYQPPQDHSVYENGFQTNARTPASGE